MASRAGGIAARLLFMAAPLATSAGLAATFLAVESQPGSLGPAVEATDVCRVRSASDAPLFLRLSGSPHLMYPSSHPVTRKPCHFAPSLSGNVAGIQQAGISSYCPCYDQQLRITLRHPNVITTSLQISLASFSPTHAFQASSAVACQSQGFRSIRSMGLHQWHRPLLRVAPGEEHPGRKCAEDATQPILQKRSDKFQKSEDEGGSRRSGGGARSGVAVVLLGWLGAKQRHLRRYAEWYNAQGLDAVTFVLPMADLITVEPAAKAYLHVDHLVEELERWLQGEGEGDGSGESGDGPLRRLVFHTFSNTGWLTYGAILRRLRERHGEEGTVALIHGCVVDSAPVLRLDPEVWAAGFAAALLKKRSSSFRAGNKVFAEELPSSRPEGQREDAGSQPAKVSGHMETQAQGALSLLQRSGMGTLHAEHALDTEEVDALLIKAGGKRGGGSGTEGEAGPDGERSVGSGQDMGPVEWTLRTLLTQFFSVFLKVPAVQRRLEEVTEVLEKQQPPCPQLYVYSTADAVIPARDVEAFMKIQEGEGIRVLGKRFTTSPHVDHFRTFPDAYAAQLESFLKLCDVL